MKLLTKLAQAGTAVVVVSSLVLSTSSAFAGTGQIVPNNDRYKIANLTQGTDFANTQSAKACDTLEYKLSLYNPGPDALNTVKVEAGINNMKSYTSYVSTATAYTPDGAVPSASFEATLNTSTPQTQSYVAKSTQLLNSAGNVINSSDPAAGGTLADTVTMGGGGINVGSIGESVTEYLQFKTTLNCPTPPPPPATPVYSCDAFNITADVNRNVKVSTFSTTAKNGAAFKNAVVDWGDKTSPLSNANIVGQSHQYAASAGNGPFTVTATATFTIVNGKDVTATGPQCQKHVTFTPNTPPQVTPPTPTPPTPAAPTALVNTGPGSVAELFGAATIVGTVGYRRMLARRLSRQ
jgi:hypothetical protein